MKKSYIVSGLIVMVAALTSLAGVNAPEKFNVGDIVSGRIGVGSNRGTACGFRVTEVSPDIFGSVTKIEMGQYKSDGKKWMQVSDSFKIRESGGQYEGSIQKADKRTGQIKKVTIRIFSDSHNGRYKAILDTNNLGPASEANRFTVCEGMVLK